MLICDGSRTYPQMETEYKDRQLSDIFDILTAEGSGKCAAFCLISCVNLLCLGVLGLELPFP